MSDETGIIARIRSHGGLRSIHVVPFTGPDREHRGWHNVALCADGTRIGLSLEDEEVLMYEKINEADDE